MLRSAGESSSEAVDESAFANKVEVKILQGSSTQGNPAYGPEPASAPSDALVTWVNEDTVPHTATSGTGPEDPETGKLFDTSIIMPAAKAERTCRKNGSRRTRLPLYCSSIHERKNNNNLNFFTKIYFLCILFLKNYYKLLYFNQLINPNLHKIYKFYNYNSVILTNIYIMY